jgi:hypothetical protein
MRGVRVRFRDGSTDEWEVKDAMRLEDLATGFRRTLGKPQAISFAAASEGNAPTDYDLVGLFMADAVSWQVFGLANPQQEAALWAELEGL